MKTLSQIIKVKSLFLFAFFILMPSYALADITITPTRIVFEDRDRFQEVTLVNSGNETKTYDIGWQFYRMIQDREPPYETVEGSITEFDLSQYIVYTPRRVTLSPGGSQKIRMALRRPADVQPGEYRAHMTFKALPDDEPIVASDGNKQIQRAAVKVNVSYSIPVIFRAGEPNVQAAIESVTFQRNKVNGMLEALVKITRAGGPYGILGHLYIYDPKGEVIGEIGNAHIFPEIQSRTFKVPLINEENLSGGSIKIELAHYSKSSSKVYAERSFPVQ